MAIAPRNFSRQDYDKMIGAGILREDERVELIAGRVLQMSPEGPRHAGTIDLVAEVLRRVFGPEHTVRVQHPLIVDPQDEPEPDIAVVRGNPRAHLSQHPRDPVLVVEVAETSLAFDRQDKAQLYARANVPEYWIVNLIDRRIEVHRDPAPGGYRDIAALAADEIVAPLASPAAAIPIATLLP
jgi:Uma2 family endonuclease